MKHSYLILLLLSTVFSCKNVIQNNMDTAFFGGEIINPKSDKLILYNKNSALNDTLYLDDSNRFLHQLDNIKQGVYTFRHGEEIQFVIIEPNDSIMIRLNAYDFDESLVYTGTGAKKNNYLIETFLRNEKMAANLMKYSQKNPEDFKAFIEARHKKQQQHLNEFLTKTPVSDFASSILKACIEYHNYADMEIYPFAYFGENRLVHYKDLPDDFYTHRNTIDYNKQELSELFAYNRYLFSHFDNLALDTFYTNNEFHSRFNRHEIEYNKAKLRLIDSLVQDTKIKNNLLKYKTKAFINNAKNKQEINDIMAVYLSKATNESHIEYMNNLIASIDKLMPGKDLPDLEVLNLKDKAFKISEIVNKPTLIYFWSSNYKRHYKNSHYRVKELKQKFPNMAFMSININDNPGEYWKQTLNHYKFDLDNEYRFKNPKEALETLAVNYVYKVIIVDRDANIINSNVNIFNDDFEVLLNSIVDKEALVLR